MAYASFCGWTASRLARSKNRGTDEWFVCGVIFGLFAVVALRLLPPLEPRSDGATNSEV